MTTTSAATNEGFLERIADASQQVFLKHGQLSQAFFFLDPHGDLAMFPAPWADHDERALYLAVVTKALKMCKAERYAFASEVWMATYDSRTSSVELMPSEREDRKEGLMIGVSDKHGKTLLKMFRIERDGDGKPRLELEANMDGTDFTGELTTLLVDPEEC